MIVRPRSHWLRMLFVWRGSVIPHILPQLALIAAVAAVVTLADGAVFGHKLALTAVPFTLLGITLAIFLGFRNTVSYERYWEARKLWGGLLNDSRSLARQVLTVADAAPERQREIVYALIAFVHALRHQLRGSRADADLARLLPADAAAALGGARFVPALLLLRLGESLRALRREGALEPVLLPALEQTLSRLSDVLGGCERIAGTPIPFAYSLLLHRTIYLYSFLLPFALVDAIGAVTPLIVVFIAYTFFGLEALAEEIQDPFGVEQNDLPLAAMSDSIEATLREMLGEGALPPPRAARDYVLL
ncbi:bestrophin family protein [Solimonas flava]|uniref:bestrophin family protein n=1 Tax=Solimonas flava TaxID=415849 RepID=UPI00040B9CDA|nr:bestrophin family ion channel [Solimonas flava]